jgi:AcrR family transcriptional regulator
VKGRNRARRRFIGQDGQVTNSASLNRTRIVDAAVSLLEHEGAAGLSMRRLAEVLDSKPMTLYHYVPNKSTLLALAMSEVAARMDFLDPQGPPRERMIAVAMDMYERLSEVPWIVDILRQGTVTGIPALAIVDRFFTAAAELGADDQTCLDLWRAVWYLVIAQINWDGVVAARRGGERSWYQDVDPADVATMPRVAAMLPRWGDLAAGFELSKAVAAQIDGTFTSR